MILKIKKYQMEDVINTLLDNNYIVEIEKNKFEENYVFIKIKEKENN